MADIRFHADGQTYEVDLRHDFNAVDARLFRDQLGFGIAEGMTHLFDVDVLATFIWLHRRKANATLRWEEVAERVTIADVDKTLSQRVPGAPDEGGDQDDTDPE